MDDLASSRAFLILEVVERIAHYLLDWKDQQKEWSSTPPLAALKRVNRTCWTIGRLRWLQYRHITLNARLSDAPLILLQNFSQHPARTAAYVRRIDVTDGEIQAWAFLRMLTHCSQLEHLAIPNLRIFSSQANVLLGLKKLTKLIVFGGTLKWLYAQGTPDQEHFKLGVALPKQLSYLSLNDVRHVAFYNTSPDPGPDIKHLVLRESEMPKIPVTAFSAAWFANLETLEMENVNLGARWKSGHEVEEYTTPQMLQRLSANISKAVIDMTTATLVDYDWLAECSNLWSLEIKCGDHRSGTNVEFPASLRYLKISASTNDRVIWSLLEKLKASSFLPHLESFPDLRWYDATRRRDWSHQLLERYILMQRDIAANALFERGLEFLPYQSKDSVSLWELPVMPLVRLLTYQPHDVFIDVPQERVHEPSTTNAWNAMGYTTGHPRSDDESFASDEDEAY